jgi:hypothetical protein
MTTKLDGTLKREITINGLDYTLSITPQGMTLALKGKRKGLDLEWSALVNGDAALASALNASLNAPLGEPTAESPARCARKKAKH